MVNIYIIGSKGIPARYGGFETFVDQLTQRKQNAEIQYHVSCLNQDKNEFVYNGARCFSVKVPKVLGSAGAVIYDIKSLAEVVRHIKKNKQDESIIYILACRIGPFMRSYIKKVKKYNVKVFINPDGHEWKRDKWNYWIKKYWKFSEKLMVKQADLTVCDSKSIESYIQREYARFHPNTTFIAYGAEVGEDKNDENLYVEWLRKHKLESGKYYLIVGRFVPENNYETVIKEFMKSNSDKKLVIISNVENNKFYKRLALTTGFEKDDRIMFVGTVYDQKLLAMIRKRAFAYFHGHEVGGTNPSLLEALATTKINVLLDVNFNREVAEDGAVYFTKQDGNLEKLIEEIEKYDVNVIEQLMVRARNRIRNEYNWDLIVDRYEQLFMHTVAVEKRISERHSIVQSV
ncbi:beta 1-4 rhamnosyltransferase Cps2T [Marinicrinis lubricantis]|uniref:Beta 1-4 rhamnosyltransferase Cps2T n=1 Tax=Marinicrinis lubricantis TaxID=2086470 RepID=A0ABW1IK45_9BACL